MTVQEYLNYPDELRKQIRDKENQAAFLRRMMEEGNMNPMDAMNRPAP